MSEMEHWWQPWWILGLFAFLLHFSWEQLQAPLYADLAEASHWPATVSCLKATLGDVLIGWVAYGTVAVGVRSIGWIKVLSVGRIAGYLMSGVGITVGLEILNAYVLGRWSYGDAMPLVAGIGLSPLLQWITLPSLTIWLTRRHLGLNL